MWESAVRLDAKTRDVIQSALASGGTCEGMRLLLVGHSLGGGVASLLAIRWKDANVFPDVQCVAFAPPCTVSEHLARDVRDYVTCLVLADGRICA
jgi:pimeloyl-ACP methyl ester carboxylesterase